MLFEIVSFFMVVFIFWYCPIQSVKRVNAVKGIGIAGKDGERIDEETVKQWKRGRFRAKRTELMFGTIVIAGTLIYLLTRMMAGELSDSATLDALNVIKVALMAVGGLGFLGGLSASGMNNYKHLGQLWVRL